MFLRKKEGFFPSVRKHSELQIFAVNEDGERKLGPKNRKKRLQMQCIYRNAETEEAANFELYVEVDRNSEWWQKKEMFSVNHKKCTQYYCPFGLCV